LSVLSGTTAAPPERIRSQNGCLRGIHGLLAADASDAKPSPLKNAAPFSAWRRNFQASLCKN
jgi:hypothetical protein